jgi:3-oxoacyl-[acyl-carrier-protein] synthase-3
LFASEKTHVKAAYLFMNTNRGKLSIKTNVKISGTGAYTPEIVYTNEYLETIVPTNAQWIYETLGIRERRIAGPNEATSDLAAEAARRAIAAAGLQPEDIQLIIVATTTPDRLAPSSAVFVQDKIGAYNAAAFDISAVCTGFLYALKIASQFIAADVHQHILVIGADTFSKITDWTRRDCVFFGDGAGALVLSKHEPDNGLSCCSIFADGRGREIWTIPAGGSEKPTTEETVKERLHFWQMDGKGIYNTAVKVLPEVITEVLEACQLTLNDIKYIIPHQPSIGILKSVAQTLNFDWNRVLTNMDRYANTSAATVPLLLDETVKAGKLSLGDNVIFAAVGSGMAWGAMVYKWV